MRVLLACTVFLFVSIPSLAQHVRVLPQAPSSVPEAVGWSSRIGQQLAQSLTSPATGVKEKALVQVIELAHLYGDRLDLKAVVPVLVSIYRSDPVERYRLAAVAALHAIGDEDGMQQVRHYISWQPSGRVQVSVLGALMDYYGPATFEGARDMAEMAEALLEKARARRAASAVPFTAAR